MRAFAVLLVVIAHSGLGHIVPGGSGVTIFFSISGFIITFLILRERDKTDGFSAPAFYFRRLMKIGPPFVLVILVPTGLYAIWNSVDWAHVAGQVFFVFNWTELSGDANVLPGSGVVWSLAIEEQFYIVFALIWLGMVRSRLWRSLLIVLAGVAVAFSTVLRVVMAQDPGLERRIYFGTDTRLDGIAWGVLAGVAYHFWHSKNVPSAITRILSMDWILIGAIGLYLVSLIYRDEWFRDTFRFSIQSISACLVILYGLLPGHGPLRRYFYAISSWAPVSIIGLASYSIYLVHLVLVDGLRNLLPGFPLWSSVAILSAVGLGTGIGIFYLVERPAHKFRALMEAKFATKAGGSANNVTLVGTAQK